MTGASVSTTSGSSEPASSGSRTGSSAGASGSSETGSSETGSSETGSSKTGSSIGTSLSALAFSSIAFNASPSSAVGILLVASRPSTVSVVLAPDSCCSASAASAASCAALICSFGIDTVSCGILFTSLSAARSGFLSTAFLGSFFGTPLYSSYFSCWSGVSGLYFIFNSIA